jgi:hypothetical protein
MRKKTGLILVFDKLNSRTSSSYAVGLTLKAGERLLRHFTDSDEKEVVHQALMWCQKN